LFPTRDIFPSASVYDKNVLKILYKSDIPDDDKVIIPFKKEEESKDQLFKSLESFIVEYNCVDCRNE